MHNQKSNFFKAVWNEKLKHETLITTSVWNAIQVEDIAKLMGHKDFIKLNQIIKLIIVL